MSDDVDQGLLLRKVKEEMRARERAGLEQYRRLSEGEITKEEFEERAGAIGGHGLWWDTDASFELADMEVMDVTDEGDGVTEVVARCWMTAHRAAKGPQRRVRSTMRFKLDGDMNILGLDLEWD